MFKALYRKYRPQGFSDVVGQKHIVDVLQNAIEKNKIAHAYIFYGPRGTGKTSIAKIFANEVNNNEQYLSDSVDIIEIDAASNNGVDEIRDIKEAIKFAPTEGKYKVYIIDEVHMLTTSAFNALLKTLEEPPAHIIFILATTELHKIPATILSRCQKFEFKNITTAELSARLKHIANIENINIEDAALEKITTIAKGGLRDAIGILDQVSNYNLEKVTLQDVLDVTSSLSDGDVLDFYKLILENNATDALVRYTEFVQAGKDTKLLLNDLINISRDIVIYKNLKSQQFCEYNLDNIVGVLENVASEVIYRNIEELANAESSIRFSTEFVSYMQICIIKMASAKIEGASVGSVSVADSGKVTELEKKVLMLENKLAQLSENSAPVVAKKVDSNTFAQQLQSAEPEQNIELPASEPLIIPNKKALQDIISNGNEALTVYAGKVFNQVLRELAQANNELFAIFKNSRLQISSKSGGLIIFDDQQLMFQANSNYKYKEQLDILLSQKIGVRYAAHILQNNQYDYLLKTLAEEEQKAAEPVVEEKEESKIEQLFSEIIVEK